MNTSYIEHATHEHRMQNQNKSNQIPPCTKESIHQD